ncbi:MAG: phosphomannose isomerase type II C-terminal cupin domain, partial [Candidatus Marinimicrobia bacterium]|nr:phosphomannose isomerase type II C-terminal cupin domain [Candidatus Neomarinimicrobiota bacterium]
RLSLQSHRQRNEHWVIAEGKVKVVNNDDGKLYHVGDHIFIPRGNKHRIENIGNEKAVFIEVQLGEYLGEDDIIRYEDDYQRV